MTSSLLSKKSPMERKLYEEYTSQSYMLHGQTIFNLFVDINYYYCFFFFLGGGVKKKTVIKSIHIDEYVKKLIIHVIQNVGLCIFSSLPFHLWKKSSGKVECYSKLKHKLGRFHETCV